MDEIIDKMCLLLWAKTSEESVNWHPLIWHMIDSGTVAKIFWRKYLSVSFKWSFCQLFSLEDQEACNLLSFWVSLHDIGKAGPAFQKKSADRLNFLKDAGYPFPTSLSKEQGYHGLASTWILRDYFLQAYPQHPRFGNALAIVLGGHHGEFPSNSDILDSTYKTDHLGNVIWQNLRDKLIEYCSLAFSPPKVINFPNDRKEFNPILTIIAGITTTSDWIASNTNYFSYHPEGGSLRAYAEIAEQRALFSLEDLGWGGWSPPIKPASFSDLFPDFNPNNLQKTIIENISDLNPPFLLIIEAQTGSGKTEAALYVADHEIQSQKKAGFYIAMPTQATSNQMFERTVNFLQQRYPKSTVNVHLVHGSALLNDFVKKIRFSGVNQDGNSLANIVSEEWFLPRKKTLLAPFGVGTVDQTFLSVMRSKHFFLRLFGLSNKVVIFDEVHAYDVYMVEIFKRLLSWLRAVNTSVIILSATLPRNSRMELIEAFGGDPSCAEDCEFPRLTRVDADKTNVIQAGTPDNRRIDLNWIDDIVIEKTLQEYCGAGGNVAIICNRVARVQELFERLQLAFPNVLITVFHSRFPYCWRKEIEDKVINLYGKDTHNRPKFSIVIATQVIEQSLDLDFDLIISDLAPVDLLIQRIGRLHRHTETNALRPARLIRPKIFLVNPNIQKDGMPEFGKDGYVYEKYILERTYFAIRTKNEVLLPNDTDELINEVYSQEKSTTIPDIFWDQIKKDFDDMVGKNASESIKASNQLIPDYSTNFLGKIDSAFSDEHDPQSYSIIQTLTRNAPPSVQIVCLLQIDSQLVTLSGERPIDLNKEPGLEETKECLQSTINITNWKFVQQILHSTACPGWKKSASLRTKYPIIFTNDSAVLGNFLLHLDRHRGLTISNIS